MTTTQLTAQAAARAAVLDRMSAPEGAEWFTWRTVSAALDRAQGALWIAADQAPSPEDWESVCLLLELAGFDNGTGSMFPQDPGEPAEVTGLATWKLSLGVSVG